jgi:hypothetical protein
LPTDLGRILTHLTAFYDFRDKVVVHVGAGGGQLLGYAPLTRRVVAIDRDPAALQRLHEKIATDSLEAKVAVMRGDIEDLTVAGDVVLLEFCLHEMRDPGTILRHTRALAPEVVVIDHRPDSRWVWYANEAEDMARAWEAVAAAGVEREQTFHALQRFEAYRDLVARFAGLGEEALKRIRELEYEAPIEIAMPYGIALVPGKAAVRPIC